MADPSGPGARHGLTRSYPAVPAAFHANPRICRGRRVAARRRVRFLGRMEAMTWTELVLRLLAASVCGLLIGLERESKRKPAGLRTHLLVAVGAAGFMLITDELFHEFDAHHTGTAVDPLRVLSGIVGGIGFLGAGAIIQSQGNVRGITTAAGIWIVGAIGAACGVGYYPIAIAVTVMGFAILAPLRYIEHRYHRSRDGGDADED